MTMDTKTLKGSRVCFALTPDGLTAYGNKAALRSLAHWLEWLADSNPEDHYECHTSLSLETEEVLLNGAKPKNVWVLVDGAFQPILNQWKPVDVEDDGLRRADFDVKFMAVTDIELDEMALEQSSGLLPKEVQKG